MANPADPSSSSPVEIPRPAMPAEVVEQAHDWPAQATDTIVNLVDQVRDKTTGPILTAARAVVFGLMVGVMVTIAAILLLIFVVRVFAELMPVWAAYLLLGSIFTLVGALVFRRRHIAHVI